MTNLVLNTKNATAYNTTQTTITMTSLEIVEFINNHRKANGNDTVLAHSDFMRKVPEVLGEQGSRNFSDTYLHPQNKQTYACYTFPKREACLMAMSYSYELQAEIFDRMTALEQQLLLVNRPSYMIEDPVERAKKWIEETTAKQEIETKLVEASKVIEIQTPKAEVFDAVLDSSRTYSIREFAQRTGVKEGIVKQWIVDKRWATGSCSKTFRPAAWSNVNNLMRMVRTGKPHHTKYGTVVYPERIEFTQEGYNEAVRKMTKADILKPLFETTALPTQAQ